MISTVARKPLVIHSIKNVKILLGELDAKIGEKNENSYGRRLVDFDFSNNMTPLHASHKHKGSEYS